MARIKHLDSHEEVELRACHTFGRRSDLVDSLIQEPEISKIHALIEYKNNNWFLKDLSKNGTWLNGKKLSTAKPTKIKIGDNWSFSPQSKQQWQLIDDSEPLNKLFCVNENQPPINLQSYTLLPDDENPTAAVYFEPSEHLWRLEYNENGENGNFIDLSHNSTFFVNNRLWKVFLTETIYPTIEISSMDFKRSVEFVFSVSQDEETIQIGVNSDFGSFNLGERSHHELILYLARLRDQHKTQGVSTSEQGWCTKELISRELGLDENHINIYTYRARKQLSEATGNKVPAETLFERRRGQIRLGSENIIINKPLDHSLESA
ncbi:FHA domain-containing protein [Sessilibacter corallicola]|uniref:FHA domain-containing protein n=1 Tax=Sessilibacter corallicola TaxID=2904075 RepID=A0ABQ0ADW6_9GAMM|nr:FHA domain-containing protein [Sessilibacter corallicola]MCE2027421.1 FHA domain-containing protein [Sessilibacter corallicola]